MIKTVGSCLDGEKALLVDVSRGSGSVGEGDIVSVAYKSILTNALPTV